ncbi:MAG TPA: hypothetical protein VHK91_16230 [Flavisolibacter sp.]|nr:hypothetical protein [Flavisolibacter sp.]
MKNMDLNKYDVTPQGESENQGNSDKDRQDQKVDALPSRDEKSPTSSDSAIPVSHLAGLHDLGASGVMDNSNREEK